MDADDVATPAPRCPYCGSASYRELGPMGAWHWYRCRDCGEAWTREPRGVDEGESSMSDTTLPASPKE